VSLSACALKGDVRRVEAQLAEFREETGGPAPDSARAVVLGAVLDEVMAIQQRTLDSLLALERRVARFQGDVRTDMTEVQRQLVQVQELTGQSQQRLSELRTQLDDRLYRPVAPMVVVSPTGDTTVQQPLQQPQPGGGIDAQELYDLSLQNLRRGSPLTAREGFRRLLADFPQHPLAPHALFFIGESWEESEPDSAASAYEAVVEYFGDSQRAPMALYRLGLLAERRGDNAAAQVYYSRVIAGYPRSEEAELARLKLQNPGR
jgi:TolA-binding protein